MKFKLKNLLLLAIVVTLGFTSCDLESLNQNIQTKMDVKALLESSSNKSFDGDSIYTFSGEGTLNLDDYTDIKDNIESLEALSLDSISYYFSLIPEGGTLYGLQVEIIYMPNAGDDEDEDPEITVSELGYVTNLNIANLDYCQIIQTIYQRLLTSRLNEGNGASLSDLNNDVQSILEQVIAAVTVSGVPNFEDFNLEPFCPEPQGGTLPDGIIPGSPMDPDMPPAFSLGGNTGQSTPMDSYSVQNLGELFRLMKENDYKGEITFSVNGTSDFDLNTLDNVPEFNLEFFTTLEINGADLLSGV